MGAAAARARAGAARTGDAVSHSVRARSGPPTTERLRALGDDLRRVVGRPHDHGARQEGTAARPARRRRDRRRARRRPRPPHPALARGHHHRHSTSSLPHSNPPRIRTDEDSLALIQRLAPHYPDAVIAGILNRQGKRTARGDRFTAAHVGNLRRYRGIPRYEPPAEHPDGELVTIKKAAEILGVAPSTLHRWLTAGIIVGEQLTPGAPWRIRMTDELRARFVEEAPPEYLPMLDATPAARGVSPDGVAACQAWRARSAPRPPWTAKRLANQGRSRASRPLPSRAMNWGAVCRGVQVRRQVHVDHPRLVPHDGLGHPGHRLAALSASVDSRTTRRESPPRRSAPG